jgi:oxygen-independent coproporphyrinogen-3 oxidase
VQSRFLPGEQKYDIFPPNCVISKNIAFSSASPLTLFFTDLCAMPGIYIHVPFCKQACHYCDFHFSTSLKLKGAFLEALHKEIVLRKGYFGDGKPKIGTIYFGGGTPSLLSGDEIKMIFDVVHEHYDISPDAEITLEANPDDLTKEKVRDLRDTAINRFSVGIQSFFDEDLRFMNRAHNAQEAISSVKRVQDAGFDNITIDLIYGTPTMSTPRWKQNLETAFGLQVPHVSAYSLTVEERTPLAHMVKMKKVKNIDEHLSAEHFHVLMDEMKKHDFIQYEISNFCREGFYSRHNSSYWKGEKYLGLGPSAHSYNGSQRQWNIANNSLYIKALSEGRLECEVETLTEEQKYNEYILTTLRTIWGTDLSYIERSFGSDAVKHCLHEAEGYLTSGMLGQKENKLFLTGEGKLIADRIASDLFYIKD